MGKKLLRNYKYLWGNLGKGKRMHLYAKSMQITNCVNNIMHEINFCTQSVFSLCFYLPEYAYTHTHTVIPLPVLSSN